MMTPDKNERAAIERADAIGASDAVELLPPPEVKESPALAATARIAAPQAQSERSCAGGYWASTPAYPQPSEVGGFQRFDEGKAQTSWME